MQLAVTAALPSERLFDAIEDGLVVSTCSAFIRHADPSPHDGVVELGRRAHENVDAHHSFIADHADFHRRP